MVIFPPMEGLEGALTNAYSGVTSFTRDLLEKAGLLKAVEATQLDPATMTALGSVAGPATAVPRIGQLMDRYRALSMSPLWDTMTRMDKLNILRGSRPQHVTHPELIGLPKRGTQTIDAHMRSQLGKEGGAGFELLEPWHRERLGYLKDLLKGAQ